MQLQSIELVCVSLVKHLSSFNHLHSLVLNLSLNIKFAALQIQDVIVLFYNNKTFSLHLSSHFVLELSLIQIVLLAEALEINLFVKSSLHLECIEKGLLSDLFGMTLK